MLGRCMTLNWQVLVLMAPCGFGKTSLLAELARRQRKRGATVAWLGLRDDCSGDFLLSSLASALGRYNPRFRSLPERLTDDTYPHRLSDRVRLTLQAIADYAKPCLVAFDEVERLCTADGIALLNFLLRRGPHNLYVAMAMRSIPAGLDLAAAALGDRGVLLTAEDLRFSDPEIGRFLGGSPTRKRFAEVVDGTEGWPVAVHMARNSQARNESHRDSAGGPEHEQVVLEFLCERLMRDLNEESRQLLLDIAVLDVKEMGLLPDVLAGDQGKRLNDVLSRLRGLVHRTDAPEPLLGMNPAVRAMCRAGCRLEDDARFRTLQRRVARALARRGKLEDALRYAAEANDDELRGELLEDAGASGYLFSNGADALRAVCRHLDDPLAEARPRLALMRCAGLVVSADLAGAQAQFDRVRAQTADFTRGRPGGNAGALRAERTIVRALWLAYSCQAVDSPEFRTTYDELTGLAVDGCESRALQGGVRSVLCQIEHQQARFDASLDWGTRASESFADAASLDGQQFVDLQYGIVAMARGNVREAIGAYSRCGTSLVGNVLLAELQIERNRSEGTSALGGASESLARQKDVGGWLDVHAAAHGNAIAAAYERGGAESALGVVEESLRYATDKRLPALKRILSGQRISYLADSAPLEAQRAWVDAKLPVVDAELLDLDGQSWREFESVGCARIRLLGACGAFGEGRAFAGKIVDKAWACGLRRTLMRCLVEWTTLEYRASCRHAATDRLIEFLRVFVTTDYSRALLRDRRIIVPVLKSVLEKAGDGDVLTSAGRLLERVNATQANGTRCKSRHTAREIAIMQGLARGQATTEIAHRLGLTESGVRYHLKNIYRSMGVRGRVDAVRIARSHGIVA